MSAYHDTSMTTRAGDGVPGEVRLRQELEPSARALVAAEDSEMQRAMDSVRWERRGILQRLMRRER